jgi:hypothetical protein
MKKLIIFLIPVVIFFLKCSNPTIRFNALYPAQIDIPTDIQSIAVIDRTVPENKLLNVLEGGITGEGIGQDKLASQITLDAVSRVLQNSSRFRTIRTNESLIGSKSGSTLPDPLPWTTVQQLASKYDVDVVLSLETFDTDFVVTDGSRQVEQKDGEGNVAKVTQYFAQGVATINLGFRLYDPVEKSIIDQFHFSENRDWEGTGNTVNDAVKQLIARDEAVKEVSERAGRLYGERITPTWYKITRTYYKKAKDNPALEEGARWMESNNWDEALHALQRALSMGEQKSRGYAAHNLAIVYEILGDFETAKEWAQKAWAQYENKGSREYAYQLNQRIRNKQRLDNQMGN